jgi:Bacterial Ig-like domain (group 3)/FG-GAP-like repeat/FG-GAP repeat
MWNVSVSACSRVASFRRLACGLLLTVACTLPTTAQAAQIATTTSLKLSAPSLTWHSPVTLIASVTVTASGVPVTAGSITFCDVSLPYTRCEDAAVVGSAQLDAKTATATFTYIPAIGSHHYTAIFNATTLTAASASPAQNLVVTGLYPTTTAIAATGNSSGYGLMATVVGFGNHPPVLAGTVSFEDTTNGNFVLGTAALGPPTYAWSFVRAPQIPSGNQPTTAAAADFNGDGIPDLAIRTSYDTSMYIMLGNGDGTFRAAPNSPFTEGITPCINPDANSNCSVAAGDFDNNGKTDLAITSGYDNTVIILLGNGDGTFTPARNSPIPINFPQSVKVGDFNNDGRLDLAVTDATDNTVSIQLGNGDGTFTAAPSVPVGAFPYFTAIADFNQDGNADIAVTNNTDNTVSIFLGNGDGTFTQAPGSPIPDFNYNPVGIVAADFNKDGFVDLAATNYTGNGQNGPGNVVVLLGNNDGTFKAAPGSPITTGLHPIVLVAMDFDHDGNTDLVVENSGEVTNPSTETLAILKGNGDGTFTQPYPTTPLETSQGGQSGPSDLIAADFNGDGATDVSVPNFSTFDTTILLNEATQTATASVSNITITGTGTHYVDAVYPGNTSFAPSTSSTLPLQGSTAATTLTLTAKPTEQMVTMSVTFTAQLGRASSQPLFGTPTGTVTFYDQSVGAQLGTAPMGTNGQAVLTISTIGPGVHSVSASYGGDPGFLSSASNAVTVTIDELRITRLGNNNTTILPGTTVVYTLQVEPQVATTFLYNVSFTASGLPAGASATFSPATLEAGSKTTNITMTVTTATTAMNAPPPSPFERLPLALGFLLPLFGTRAVRRRLRQLPPFLAVALFAALNLAAVAGLSGCSGAGLFAARKVPYSITVTATEGTVQRTVEVPLAIR